MTVDYDALGLPLDPPGVRIARLDESLAVVQGRVGRRPVHFDGEHYRITDSTARRSRCSGRTRRSSSVVAAEGAAPRRARGRDRRHQREPARRRDRRRRRARHASATRPLRSSSGSARARASASTTSSCRSATSSPRSPTTPAGFAEAMAPRVRRRPPTRRSASGAVLAGTVDEICDTLVAPPRGVGRVLRRDRRRHLRGSSPRSSPASPAPESPAFQIRSGAGNEVVMAGQPGRRVPTVCWWEPGRMVVVREMVDLRADVAPGGTRVPGPAVSPQPP